MNKEERLNDAWAGFWAAHDELIEFDIRVAAERKVYVEMLENYAKEIESINKETDRDRKSVV